jgi:hypothetical protein
MMRRSDGLSAADVLDVVDAAADADAAARGRALLAVACPDLPDEGLDAVTLGQRDARILALRCATLGDPLAARVGCPACGASLSVRVPRSHVTPRPVGELAECMVRVEASGVVVIARPPDGAALAAACACPDVTLARAALVRACVIEARAAGEPVDPLTLDPAVLEAVGEAIVEAEPEVELRLPMTCASCAHEWAPVLDIVHFFWRELTVAASQLVDEIHQLATGYGWTEDQVLRLPSRRRRRYVERLLDG